MPDTIIRDDLDRPLWGAAAIAREANVVDSDGNLDLRRAFYLLENKRLPATKVGRLWASTPRRIRAVFSGESA
jgi:hypothetical protein